MSVQERGLTGGDSTAIDALSTAAGPFARRAKSIPARGLRAGYAYCVIASLLAGTALTLAGRFEHRCRATLRISAVPELFDRPAFREALLDFVPGYPALLEGAGVRPLDWFVDAPSADSLRLSVVASSRTGGLDAVRLVAEAFEDHIRSRADSVRATPTATEAFVSTTISTLEQRLALQQGKADEAMLLVSGDDPESKRARLLEQWKELRDEFSQTRANLESAVKEADVLRNEVEPAQGLVESEARRQALEADSALQQDLKELAVNLTELKQHMLSAWQDSIDPLKTLDTATESLILQLRSEQLDILWSSTDTDNHPLLAHAQDYRNSLTIFLELWTEGFSDTQAVEVDPYEGKLLDSFERARHELNDFLFHSSKELSSMRSAIRLISSSPVDSAQFHVAQAGLTRAFQAVQTAHHRFEFAGSAIDTASNFRIDTAARASRGLRRRTRIRIKAIDVDLQEAAARTARTRHARTLKDADRRVAQIRLAADAAVDELLTIQDTLHLRAAEAAEFLQHSITLGLATARVDLTRDYLDRARSSMKELEAKRVASAEVISATLISCDSSEWPINLWARIGFGSLGAVLVFAATLWGRGRLSAST